MKSAMGAREQPLMISISTAGYVSDGIYDELMKRSTAVLLGTSREKRLLPFLYQIDEVEQWNDINELRKSNPNLGVSVSVDYLLEEIAIAEGSLSKRSEFLCKYCNIRQNSSQAWLDARTIENSIGAPLRLEDFSGCYAVMGIDLSKTTDLSAAVLLIERDGIINTFARFYLPKEKIDEASARDNLPYRAYIQRGLLFESGENFIDYQDIYNWVVELVSKYHIYPLKVGYDRYSATYLVQALDAAGIQTDDVYQGTNLTPVIRITEGLMKDGKINIGDNDLLKMHLLNSAIKMSNERGRGKLVKVNSTLHIDGCAALLDALTVRQKWYGEIGAQLRN
jgi:phage terminase large subunit-like protein